MQFKSVSGIGLTADGLIRQYFHFSGDSGMLRQGTDTRNAPKLVIELRALRSHAVAYRDRAQALIADPGFLSLDADVQADITAIAEETSLAVNEIDEEADAEKKWSKMSRQQKDDATQRVIADNAKVDAIRARLEGRLRGVPAVTPPNKPN